jgi:BirA family transcriptional regulator, biotin operon repressor / biotin---[acetyl-CoA-carboxylase] ligase
MIPKEEFEKGLNTRILGQKLFVYDTVNSTNTWAKKIAAIGAKEGTVVVADYQMAGHGRLGRTWVSEAGSNLLFSIIVRPRLDSSKAGLLPFFAAVGTAFAVEGITGLHCECKWPNDVLLNGKKCCGILLESGFKHNELDYAVIGIGLNVNQRYFGEDLYSKATSLCIGSGKEFDRKIVFQRVLISLESLYTDVKKGYFDITLREWNSRTAMFGKQITLNQAGQTVTGRAISLTDDGGLMLETREGVRTFYAGDVTVINQM